jgi:hypothetical protein
MRRACLIGIVMAALTAAAPAQAKGPIAGTIDGPGLGGGMTFGGHGEPGGASALGTLAEEGGFFPAAFAQTPDPMLDARPKGDLGPRYAVTYRVPGPHGKEDLIRQDLYPYAQGGPVTYTKPGQPFFGRQETRGGWYQGSPRLKEMLVSKGLPPTRPAATSDGKDSTGLADVWPAVAVAFGLGLVALTAVLVRRRPRTATP